MLVTKSNSDGDDDDDDDFDDNNNNNNDKRLVKTLCTFYNLYTCMYVTI